MGIRKYKKDHLKSMALTLTPVLESDFEISQSSELVFWTSHPTQPVLVDLTIFKNGQWSESGRNNVPTGLFSGREKIILEMAPTLKTILEYVTPPTVVQYINSLRTWWRLFDSVELLAAQMSHEIKLEAVADIQEIHQRHAHDIGMDSQVFGIFLRVLNMTRQTLGQKKLFWVIPERKQKGRHLPPKWQTNKIRFALKHQWFSALFRWEKCSELLSGGCMPDHSDISLYKNYQRFQDAQLKSGTVRPPTDVLYGNLTPDAFNAQGFSIYTMLEGFYPSATDIRAAFNLCLANSGWNPAVFLSLVASSELIEPHPKDSLRYILRGHKDRGDSEQIIEGLFKSRGSPGMIIKELLSRTALLRIELDNELIAAKKEFALCKLSESTDKELNKKRARIAKLEQGTRSVWLYISPGKKGVQWLNKGTFGSGLDKRRKTTFLENLVERINDWQPVDKKISRITPTDFRDAFAANAYSVSGGMLFYVMKALGHKSLNSSQKYLDNNLINDVCDKEYEKYGDIFWHEIKVYACVDPTILAKSARDGDITDVERLKLEGYRTLRRSRLGVGCKKPYNPPKRVAPFFIPDGIQMCPTHRCTLCLEGAVVFADSADGLCMRLAELYEIKRVMSIVAYVESSFDEETRNTEAALLSFASQDVTSMLKKWEEKILLGEHRVFDTCSING